MRGKRSWLVLAIYLVFTLAPIYWMLHMSLRSNLAITGTFAWLPESLSFANYATIFTDPAWYGGYVNSITPVMIVRSAVSCTAWRLWSSVYRLVITDCASMVPFSISFT